MQNKHKKTIGKNSKKMLIWGGFGKGFGKVFGKVWEGLEGS